jgi:hypothetical protein
MSGYLNAISPQTATITLGGEPFTVERARLGLYLLLAREADAADDALRRGDAMKAARCVCAYLSRAGFGEHLGAATGVELFHAYLMLTTLNAPLFLLPFMQDFKPGRKVPGVPYDYPDRGFVLWVHKLASRYGWSRHYIMDQLSPEETMCYLQEIMVSEYHEREEARVLSEMAYKYDKASKTLRYRPLPMPAWMAGKGERKMFRIHRDYLPKGEVVDLSEMAQGSR